MKAQPGNIFGDLLYVLALVVCALLATAEQGCGGDAPAPPADDAPPLEASDDAGADAVPAFRVCYVPSTPLRAYACGTEADCATCPASCDVPDAGEGECKP